MGIAKKSEYALRAMYELALRDRSMPTKIHDIATVQEIPPRFLEGILNELKHAGLLEARRGSEGGYWLAKAPQEVTVAEIIGIIEGQARLGPNEQSSLPGSFAFGRFWRQVDEAVYEVFRGATLANLVEWEKAQIESDALHYYI